MDQICEHINARYDSRQIAMEKAMRQREQEQNLCMLFDAVNASSSRKKTVQKNEPKQRDLAAGMGLILGMASMALFLVMGILFGI